MKTNGSNWGSGRRNPSSNGGSGLAATHHVKSKPLRSSVAAAAGFVGVEGTRSTYHGGSGYSIAHAAAPGDGIGNGCSASNGNSVCSSTLPFSDESYRLAEETGHSQTATGPILATVDANNILRFSAGATIHHINLSQSTSMSAVKTVLYNWVSFHQSVPMSPTTMLNHASFGGSGLMGAYPPYPPPPPPPQCTLFASPDNTPQIPVSDNSSLQQQEQENTSSPYNSFGGSRLMGAYSPYPPPPPPPQCTLFASPDNTPQIPVSDNSCLQQQEQENTSSPYNSFGGSWLMGAYSPYPPPPPPPQCTLFASPDNTPQIPVSDNSCLQQQEQENTSSPYNSFGGSWLMGAYSPYPPPPPPPQCTLFASPDNTPQIPVSDNSSLQQQEQENTSSPYDSGYYSATSPALTYH